MGSLILKILRQIIFKMTKLSPSIDISDKTSGLEKSIAAGRMRALGLVV
jgi:hypothetical protein